MAEAEFNYEGKIIIIQCNLETKMIDICNAFSTKAKLNINNLYFLTDGDIINLESKFNQINKGQNKIKILVNMKEKSLFLNFKLNNYNININFTESFDINLEKEDPLLKKLYKGSFTLEELKKKSKFFKMFESVKDTYNAIESLIKNNSFSVQKIGPKLTLSIKKQFGIDYDIIFPLNESSLDINEIVSELTEINKNLIKKVEDLENKINEINSENEKKYNELNIKYERKIDYLEKRIQNILLNQRANKTELLEKIETINNNIDETKSDEINELESLFDGRVKKFNLLYNGLERRKFFEKCEGKNNLLFLIKDERNMKYGGYMSSTLIKNIKGQFNNIRDEKSFIFNLDTKKKFKVKNPDKALIIRDNYLVNFGAKNKNNDLYIFDNEDTFNAGEVGSNGTESYGDENFETTKGRGNYKIKNLKVFQLEF